MVKRKKEENVIAIGETEEMEESAAGESHEYEMKPDIINLMYARTVQISCRNLKATILQLLASIPRRV